MIQTLDDVNARARGLTRHRIPPEEIRRWAHAAGCGALARELATRGIGIREGSAEELVLQIDDALRAWFRRQLGLLALWLGPRTAAFADIFEQELCADLGLLLRSVFPGAPAERLRKAVGPSPWLSARALERLQSARSPDAFIAMLGTSGSPYAAPLREAWRTEPQAPGRLEATLARVRAARACAAARRFHADLLDFVRETIDLENAGALLSEDPAASEGEHRPWVPGGRWLGSAVYHAAASELEPRARRAHLASLFRRTPLAGIFVETPREDFSFEARALRVRRESQRRKALVDPLGPAPVLGLILAWRAELHDVRRIAWGIAAGAPPAVITRELVVPC